MNYQRVKRLVCVVLVICCIFMGIPSSMADDPPVVYDKAYITSHTTGVVDVINLTTGEVELGKITVGSEPNSATANPSNTRIYITNRGDNTVSIVNPKTDTVVDTISVGGSPHGVAFNQDGSKAYVANCSDNNISVIDTGTLTVTNTIAVDSQPIAIVTVGTKLFVTCKSSNNVNVINLEDETVVDTIAVGNAPYGITANASGNTLYVCNQDSNNVSVINVGMLSVVKTVSTIGRPSACKVSKNGDFVYVACTIGNSVSVIRVSDHVVIDTIPVGNMPYAVDVGPDGKVYTLNYGSSNISVIDHTDNIVEQTIDVSGNPFMVGTFMVSVDFVIYTLTYDGNGAASSSMPSETHAEYSTFNLTENAFEREGYTFAGWEDGSGNAYANQASFTMPENNLTLYAQWDPIAVTDVVLGDETKTLKEGDTATLGYTISPSDAVEQGVAWQSSDTSIVSVDANGVITAKSEGTATITVTADDTTNGILTDQCVVTVNAAAPTPTVTPAPTDAPVDDTKTIEEISGELTDENNNTLEGYAITLHSNPVTMSTDAQGKFSFTDVPYSDHTIFVSKGSQQYGWYKLSFCVGDSTSAKVVGNTIKITHTSDIIAVHIPIRLQGGTISVSETDIEITDIIENPQTGRAANRFAYIVGGIVFLIIILAGVLRKRLVNN